MSYYSYLMPLSSHALNFYSALILSTSLIVEAFILLRLEKNSKGRQRYKCNNCKRRFINSTNHLMHWSRLSKEQWEILFYSSLNNNYLSKTAKLVGISIVSAFYNRHKLMYVLNETSVYKGYKQDKIEMRGDRAEMSDFPLYLNTVAGGLDRRDQTIGGFSFVVKIYALPVVEIIG